MRRQWFAVDWNCCLGAGGEGEVFLGRCLHTGILCAIKVSANLDHQLARDHLSSELRRHLRAAGLGVVDLVAWNLAPPRPFLVFELAHAGTLADEIRELRTQGRLHHPVHALHRARDVLVCVHRVHERGLVHRDIKPGNILRFGDHVKLTDLSTGRTIGQWNDESRMFSGTRLYAAPEHLNGRRTDRRADIHSVGCILHEMLTGEVPAPVTGASLPSVHERILVFPGLERLLVSMIHADVHHRPATATECIGRIDRVLASAVRVRRTWEELRREAPPW